MRTKITRRLGCVALVVGAMMLANGASAATFQIADTSQHGLSCDATGTLRTCTDPTGMASASYELIATTAGDLHAAVTTTSDAPAGYIYGTGVGGTRAFSYPNIQQNFYGVSAGTHSVTSVIEVSQVDVAYSPAFNWLEQGATAYARTSVYLYFFPCSSPLDSCASSTTGYHGVYLTDTRNYGGTYQAGTYTQVATFTADSPGYVQAIVYFATVAQSIGPDAYARASATGKLLSLTIS